MDSHPESPAPYSQEHSPSVDSAEITRRQRKAAATVQLTTHLADQGYDISPTQVESWLLRRYLHTLQSSLSHNLNRISEDQPAAYIAAADLQPVASLADQFQIPAPAIEDLLSDPIEINSKHRLPLHTWLSLRSPVTITPTIKPQSQPQEPPLKICTERSNQKSAITCRNKPHRVPNKAHLLPKNKSYKHSIPPKIILHLHHCITLLPRSGISLLTPKPHSSIKPVTSPSSFRIISIAPPNNAPFRKHKTRILRFSAVAKKPFCSSRLVLPCNILTNIPGIVFLIPRSSQPKSLPKPSTI